MLRKEVGESAVLRTNALVAGTHPSTAPSRIRSSASCPSSYCEFEDNEHFVEYYGHATDPWQLTNLAGKVPQKPAPPAVKARLQAFRTCKGKQCRPL